MGLAVAAALALSLVLAETALAALSISRAELSSGRLRVEGSGAVPMAGIVVDDGRAHGQADAAGNFRVEQSGFSSPSCVITVWDGATTAQAKLSGCTATAPPAPPPPAAPSPVSPSSGATVTQPVTLSWSEVTDPNGPITGYDWEVATTSTFTSIRSWGTVGAPFEGAAAPTQAKFSGLPDGIYFWRVRSLRQGSFGSSYSKSNWSAVRSITVNGSVPGTLGPPTLLTPADEKQYHPWEYFDITWTDVPGAVSYWLEFDDEPTFSYPRVQAGWPEVKGTWANGGYGQEEHLYWRVSSINADGVRGLPSPARRFHVVYTAPLPPPPTLLAPAEGETISLPYLFDWSDVENAQPHGYTIEVHHDPTFGGGIATADWTGATGPQSEFWWDSLGPGKWYWRVMSCHGHSAPDASACTAWSTVHSFVVPATPPTLHSIGISLPFAHSGHVGTDLYAWVQLTRPAPAGGAVVTLTSSDPAALGLPASVTVREGEATAFFDVDPKQVLVDTPVTLTATYDGNTKTAPFTVKPPNLRRLDIGAGVFEQVQPAGTSTVASALLNGRAPAGGAVIEFASSSPDVTVEPSATVAEGWTSAAVNVTTRKVTTTVTATITATWKGQTVSSRLTIHPPPTLVAPANGTTTASGSPVIFDWEDLAGISYWIQVDDSPQFTAPLIVDLSPSRTSSYQTSSLPVGTLYWRVQTLDSYANRGDWSEVRTLTITGAAAPPTAPSPLFPAADARFAPGASITFDWSDVSGATSYTVQIDDSSSFPSPLVAGATVSQSQWSTSTLPTTTMWWRVRATNGAGSSGWTAARRFEVKN